MGRLSMAMKVATDGQVWPGDFDPIGGPELPGKTSPSGILTCRGARPRRIVRGRVIAVDLDCACATFGPMIVPASNAPATRAATGHRMFARGKRSHARHGGLDARCQIPVY